MNPDQTPAPEAQDSGAGPSLADVNLGQIGALLKHPRTAYAVVIFLLQKIAVTYSKLPALYYVFAALTAITFVLLLIDIATSARDTHGPRGPGPP